jgi:acyl-CoA thioesterase FadM
MAARASQHLRGGWGYDGALDCRGAACSPAPSGTHQGGTVIALNLDRIGHRYPSYRYEVSREKIREYALATGHDDPRYTADEGPVVAPPAFAACFTIGRSDAMFADTNLGAHWNLVHGAQEYTYHRPVHVGDVLTCTPVIADISDRGRMELLVLEIECVEAASGDPVVTSKGTLICFKPEGGET